MSLPQTEDAVRAILAQLDYGNAMAAEGALLEALANTPDEPDFGPPEDWPDWTDKIRLDLGDGSPVNGHAPGAALYEPTERDWADFHAWCRDQDEREQDLEDARRESEYLDTLDGIARFTDDDLMAAGLPVG